MEILQLLVTETRRMSTFYIYVYKTFADFHQPVFMIDNSPSDHHVMCGANTHQVTRLRFDDIARRADRQVSFFRDPSDQMQVKKLRSRPEVIK